MLKTGENVDRFEVIELLGVGGLAQVFKVRHRVLGSLHALKVVTAGGDAVARRLLREGSIQAQLRHPNIVAVTDVLEVNGHSALVLEYVEGVTLQGLLAQRGALGVDEALALFAQVLAGVGAAHASGVLHRDLKPGNVLLAPGPNGVMAKVTDFGLAKVMIDDAPAGAGDTMQGLVMGTPGYMAPEQIGEASTADARADVFALGVLLYEMLTGVAPFTGPDVGKTLRATLSGQHVPLGEYAAVPTALAEVVERAMSLQREARQVDARALAAALYGDRPELAEVVMGNRPPTPLAISLPSLMPLRAAGMGSAATPVANPTLGPAALAGLGEERAPTGGTIVAPSGGATWRGEAVDAVLPAGKAGSAQAMTGQGTAGPGTAGSGTAGQGASGTGTAGQGTAGAGPGTAGQGAAGSGVQVPPGQVPPVHMAPAQEPPPQRVSGMRGPRLWVAGASAVLVALTLAVAVPMSGVLGTRSADAPAPGAPKAAAPMPTAGAPVDGGGGAGNAPVAATEPAVAAAPGAVQPTTEAPVVEPRPAEGGGGAKSVALGGEITKVDPVAPAPTQASTTPAAPEAVGAAPAAEPVVAEVEPVAPAPVSEVAPAASTSVAEVAAPAMARLQGTWKGVWDGRPFTLTVEGSASHVTARLETLTGQSYRTFKLDGTMDPATGKVTLAEATSPGWWVDGVVTGDRLMGSIQSPGGKKKTAYEATRR